MRLCTGAIPVYSLAWKTRAVMYSQLKQLLTSPVWSRVVEVASSLIVATVYDALTKVYASPLDIVRFCVEYEPRDNTVLVKWETLRLELYRRELVTTSGPEPHTVEVGKTADGYTVIEIRVGAKTLAYALVTDTGVVEHVFAVLPKRAYVLRNVGAEVKHVRDLLKLVERAVVEGEEVKLSAVKAFVEAVKRG